MAQQGSRSGHETAGEDSMALTDADVLRVMELLFFAYRDFVSDPDAILADLGFGRAHHRVIHFVGRHPGLRVSQLLDILRITKQSLGRVLRELIDRGYVYQQEGETDRRQRLLYLTDAGRELHERLAAPQKARIRRALAGAGPEALATFAQTLLNIVNPEDREQVWRLVAMEGPGTDGNGRHSPRPPDAGAAPQHREVAHGGRGAHPRRR
jgi:DNA-binding MarR family transcriptional regulator